MRQEERAQAKQSLEAARQIGAAEKDSRVDELRLKLGIRSGERLMEDQPPAPAARIDSVPDTVTMLPWASASTGWKASARPWVSSSVAPQL